METLFYNHGFSMLFVIAVAHFQILAVVGAIGCLACTRRVGYAMTTAVTDIMRSVLVVGIVVHDVLEVI